jgi:hypothetical protein
VLELEDPEYTRLRWKRRASRRRWKEAKQSCRA